MRSELFADDVAVTNLCLIGLIIGIIVFVILRYLKEAGHSEDGDDKTLRIIAVTALLVYLVVVFYATLACRSQYDESRSTKPLATFINAFHGMKSAQNDVTQNLLFFIPLGFLLQFLSEKKLRWYIAIPLMCLYSCAIETTQFITKLGVAQVDDVICNTLSGTVGYIAACGFTDIIRDRLRE